MKPCERSFDDPAVDSQATAVLGITLWDYWFDTAFAKPLSMWFGIVSAITLDAIRFLPRPPRLPAYLRDLIHQRKQFLNVVHIRRIKMTASGMPWASVIT